MRDKWQHFLKSTMQSFGNLTSKRKGVKTLLSVPAEYQCQCCNQVKPLNADHFQVIRKFKYGFSTYCNICDIETKRLKKQKNETH